MNLDRVEIIFMRQWFSSLSLIAILQAFPGMVIAEVKPLPTKSINLIDRVLNAKLMSNYADGKFHHEKSLTRAELAVIIVKSFHLDKRAISSQDFLVFPEDVPISHWAFKQIEIVLRTDIMKGYRGHKFFPNQKVNRAEALAIFAQAYGIFQFPPQTVTEILAKYADAKTIPEWTKKPIATIVSEGFIHGDNQGKINPLLPMTRGDMAYLLGKYLSKQ